MGAINPRHIVAARDLRKRYCRRTQVGASPGTLVADPKAQVSTVYLVSYDTSQFFEKNDLSAEEISVLKGRGKNLWIEVVGLANVTIIQHIGAQFGMHSLAIEDVINTHQRPKMEAYDHQIFIVIRIPSMASGVKLRQLSILLGNGFLLSFRDDVDEYLNLVRDRIRWEIEEFRQHGLDYLAYTLIDTVIDSYFPILEAVGEDLERLEEAVILHANDEQIYEIYRLRCDLLDLRRAIYAQRDMVKSLINDDSRLITDYTKIFLRDCYDHLAQLVDIVDAELEIASSLLEVCHFFMSARMNDVMKTPTLIATIFMPLSFIASLYGMNFDRSVSAWNMPELGWRYGYPFSLGLMAVCGIGMLIYFLCKHWIKPPKVKRRR
ncbi:magnesium and cobalt transport protein CorA [Candidatus Endolissoclinum faulkneri L2]|uniref:Magnesium transport protein CorA n=1 Tax=Candidatus Endolissoclinum faulkneri L2 TaxID=1193729 RepID=K7YFJ9_9PROT|nr:magnesium/cobalt transporter CorA [Candidatus Endolissoclinum faulkneri]AFX98360.1 magnesium and cobalt transport protein CorA [Candidatus Endolissoclinum faulkneri L2]